MFRSNSTLDDDTPEKFLKLIKECLNLVEGRRWITPYVYNGQRKYLMKKLKQAVESAQAHLILFYKGSPSPEDFVDCLKIFQLLYDLAYIVTHFIQSCCQDAWLQAVMCLTDVSEYITSLGFNLEIMRLTFLERLHLPLVDEVYKAQAHIVKEKAITDRELLLKEVNALRETEEETSPNYQLATFVYERLRLSVDSTPSQISPRQSFCIDAACLKQMEQVGKGSSATVHKALWLGIEVAKKTFTGGSSADFEKEVSILLRLYHPNITSLIGYAQGYRECSIIMELMDEDLYSLIRRRMKENKGCGPPFGIHEAIDIMLQIGGGMQYLREKSIVHRDLKSLNILVKHVQAESSRGYVLAKVSDFGLSKTKERSLTFSYQTPNVGTTRWMAPELIKLCMNEEQIEVSMAGAMTLNYPYSSDVYSFAMVCFEILTGDVPYFEDSLRAVKEKVLRGDRPKLPNLCHPRLRRLIEQCWSSDPSKRPAFVEICVELRHLKCLLLVPSSCARSDHLYQPIAHLLPSTPGQHPHNMALYQQRVLATGTVFDPEENGVWTFADFNGDGSQDLVYIKTRNTGTGKIEVHAASNESRFQEYPVARKTVFGVEDNGTWLMQDYTGDGKADLVYIKTRNTGTSRVGLGYMVEVHVVDAASRYQSYVQQTGTCFRCEDNGVWTMSSKGDLVFIKTRNTGSGKIEYHVASKSSNYQQFTQHVATDFAAEENGTWCLAPKCSGDFADLYYIKTKNTGANMVEVYAVSAGSGWKSRLISTGTSFHCEENGQWLMAHFTHQTQPDLVYIKTRNCGSGKIEVHVVEPEDVTPKSFTASSQNVRLLRLLQSNTTSVLRADLQRNDGSWRDASIDLNMFLGNTDGKFTWTKKAFGDSARQIEFSGSVLSAQLRKIDGSWASDSFDLRGALMNNDGVFQAVDVPIILAIPKGQEGTVLKQLEKALADPDFKLQAVEEADGVTTFYANAHVSSSRGVLFRTDTAEAHASVLHVAQKKGKSIEQVNADVLTDGVGVELGMLYAGVETNVNLFKAEASLFDLNIGVGVDTGFGIKNDSLSIEAAGCGFQIGRKVSISVFGASLGIDFGRLFD